MTTFLYSNLRRNLTTQKGSKVFSMTTLRATNYNVCLKRLDELASLLIFITEAKHHQTFVMYTTVICNFGKTHTRKVNSLTSLALFQT